MSGESDEQSRIIRDAEGAVANLYADVFAEVTSEIDPALVRRLEKSDFDVVFSEVFIQTMKTPLDVGLASPFGFRLSFFKDIEMVELDADIAYDDSCNIESSVIDDDGITNVKVVLRPGLLAIDELEGMLDEYDIEGKLDAVQTTTAFQLYSAGLITNAYVRALTNEVLDGIDPCQRERFDYLVEYLVDSDLIKNSVERTDFPTEELYQYLMYLPKESILRINQHRLAAGIFMRSLDEEVSKAIQQSARAFIRDFIDQPKSLSVMDKPELTKTDEGKVDNLDSYIKQKKEAASYISLQMVGIAFPMNSAERDILYRVIDED